MGGLTFDRKISLGNVLTILGMFVGGMTFLIVNEGRLSSVEAKVAKVEASLTTGELALRDTDARTTSKIDAMNTTVNDLKVALRGIETSVQFLVEAERRRAR